MYRRMQSRKITSTRVSAILSTKKERFFNATRTGPSDGHLEIDLRINIPTQFLPYPCQYLIWW